MALVGAVGCMDVRAVMKPVQPGLSRRLVFFFFSSRRRHTRFKCDWSSDVCSSDLQCRRLVELLFFETPPRPYAQVAAELGLALGSIGFTRQKCIERLRRNLGQLG